MSAANSAPYPGVDEQPANPQQYENVPAYPGTEAAANPYPGVDLPGGNVYPGTIAAHN